VRNLAQTRLARELPGEHELHRGERKLERPLGNRVRQGHPGEHPRGDSTPITTPSRIRTLPYSRWRQVPTSDTSTIATSEVPVASFCP
jgi:hypothetical protein